MRFVDDQKPPRNLAQGALLPQDAFIARDEHIELAGAHVLDEDALPLRLAPQQLERPDLGAPARELAHPVAAHGLRNDHDVRAGVLPRFAQVGEEADRLQRLPQTHFVRQDAVDAVVVQADHPVQPLQLVWAHLPMLDDARLAIQAGDALLRQRIGHERRVLRGFRHPCAPSALGFLLALLAPRRGVLATDQEVCEDLALRHQILQQLLALALFALGRSLVGLERLGLFPGFLLLVGRRRFRRLRLHFRLALLREGLSELGQTLRLLFAHIFLVLGGL
mmetsp:Transcript_8403/g.31623  ORF Transcript_8403/g.31623 Transcript_8403/m.31623 type:complete len:278 (-) Transcript_8403:245-1078(-)